MTVPNDDRRKNNAPSPAGGRSREVVAALFAAGSRHVGTAVQHRLAICCAASDCARICRWLTKGPAILDAYCMHPDRPAPAAGRNLYDALADPAFSCPAGLF